MKNVIKKSIIGFIFILFPFIISSCEEDVWFIEGDWKVVEISHHHGECPYYNGDIFTFYLDGELSVRGYQGFYERGYWDLSRNYLYIDFNGDGYEEIKARIRQNDSEYMVLDVVDYSYRSEYTLRMVSY